MNDDERSDGHSDERPWEWPAIRDVMRQLDVSQPYVLRLIQAGRIRAYRTRLGWLVDPRSVRAFEERRAARRRVPIG